MKNRFDYPRLSVELVIPGIGKQIWPAQHKAARICFGPSAAARRPRVRSGPKTNPTPQSERNLQKGCYTNQTPQGAQIAAVVALIFKRRLKDKRFACKSGMIQDAAEGRLSDPALADVLVAVQV